MSDAIRLSSITINAPSAGALAAFYADITDGTVAFEHPAWATVHTGGGRIDVQTVADYRPPSWPERAEALVHLDFLVDDLERAAARVEAAGATRFEHQPNAEHCLVFADPAGHPFCLTLIDEIG